MSSHSAVALFSSRYLLLYTARNMFFAVAPPVKVFTQGKLYYRSAYIDGSAGHLFVGAMYVENTLRSQILAGYVLGGTAGDASSWVPDLENGVLFGAFVTVTRSWRSGGHQDSAVCAFLLEDIEREFNGTGSFYELTQAGNYTLSQPLPPSQVPSPRPGVACPSGPRTLSATDTRFWEQHPLITRAPAMRHGRIFFALSGVAFRSLVAFVLDQTWGSWVICYVATGSYLVPPDSRLGKDVDCRNHVREVHPIRDGSTLYVCGTNARAPTDWQVQADDLTLVPVATQVPIGGNNQSEQAEGRCPFYVYQDSSSLWLVPRRSRLRQLLGLS
ncbi:hypothetical protein V5799_005048 [Amblyomma americanum]|uniref:Sema domain-containing protein n=1 Tax=Amblyomma americanum TaxID=6943 RepID=A0AAQ4D4C4_AMBAM